MVTPFLVYVIGAYSGSSKTIRANIAKAEAASIMLVRAGFHVITPHKNIAGYEQYEDESITYDTSTAMNLDILSRCDAIYVLDSAKDSNGSQMEIGFAREHLIPRLTDSDIRLIEECQPQLTERDLAIQEEVKVSVTENARIRLIVDISVEALNAIESEVFPYVKDSRLQELEYGRYLEKLLISKRADLYSPE